MKSTYIITKTDQTQKINFQDYEKLPLLRFTVTIYENLHTYFISNYLTECHAPGKIAMHVIPLGSMLGRGYPGVD